MYWWGTAPLLRSALKGSGGYGVGERESSTHIGGTAVRLETQRTDMRPVI